MATIFDLIEVTDISQHTTYSEANGNLIGVVDGAVSSEFDDGEFDEGDIFTLGGETYRIDLIQEPSSSGRFTLGDGTDRSFNPQSEDNLDVIFLTVSNGTETRHFIIPSDSYGDLNFQEIRTGELTDVAGNDAALVSTQDNNINVVCFTGGTMISRGEGVETPIQELSIGQLVETLDHGMQPIRWIGRRTLNVPTMLCHPRLRPVRIPAGALSAGVPSRDLCVSPQHRILVRSRIARGMFGADEVLVAARHLVGVNGIEVDNSAWSVTYVHLLFDNHEVIFADGTPCESLFLGSQSTVTLGSAQMDEIEQILGGEPDALTMPGTLRPFACGKRARKLAARHRRNFKPLIEAP
ncbi:hemolysin-type calcium-binding protein [Roseivivax marinus]|uniref:Hemolysin-type calcium-binding protein n=1 Tax=Roseivivax marinus TaxID=1379903 RepID=W4HQV5_9RHOB|nr:Hint domain-containing protein [Roseivivax marinus]ETW14808.1 hemolysin-type calcium-binding protein [Roseivivax marinus]